MCIKIYLDSECSESFRKTSCNKNKSSYYYELLEQERILRLRKYHISYPPEYIKYFPKVLANGISFVNNITSQDPQNDKTNLSISASERKLLTVTSSSSFHTFTATSTDLSSPRIFNFPR